jgi:site-specific DNA-cytosine methylase
MPCLIHRKVKGKIYRYLVESYRENSKVRQRVLKSLGAAPTLPENAPIGVVLFAGGGGADGADGVVKGITIEAIARLQSFPSWYYLPNEVNLAGSILGYSVPPLFMKALLTSD